jgi:tetratricopeptide (TPR) repeat protein
LSRECVEFCISLLGKHSSSLLDKFNAKLKCVDSIPESSVKLIVKSIDCLKSHTKQSLAIYTTLESIFLDFTPFIPGLIDCYIKSGEDFPAISILRKYEKTDVRACAALMFNHGGALFKNGKFASALFFISESANVLAGCEGVASMIVKRWEYCGNCSASLKDYSSAYIYYDRALSTIELDDWKTFVSNPGIPMGIDGVSVARIYQKAIKARIRCGDMYIPVVAGLEGVVEQEVLEFAGGYEFSVLQDHWAGNGDALIAMLEWMGGGEGDVRSRIELAKLKFENGEKEEAVRICEEAKEGIEDDEELAVIELYLGIFKNEMGVYSIDHFENALECWKGLLAVKDGVDDHERILDHMDMMVVYFGVLSFWIMRIQVLQMEFKVLSMHRAYPDAASSTSMILIALENCAIHTGIGESFLELGYTGKAGLYLARAHSIVKSAKCDVETRLGFYLRYTEYLCTIGNIEKGITIFDVCSQLVASEPELLVINHDDKVASVPMLLLITQAFYVKSKIDYGVGNISGACFDVIECLRLLAKVARYLGDGEGSGEKLSRSLDVDNLPKSLSIASFRLAHVWGFDLIIELATDI